MYDCGTNKQSLLQGHCNAIVSTAVSGDRRWLVTSDVGRDSTVIIWDSYSGVPVKTFHQGLGKGCASVAISTNAKYIATLSSGFPQTVCIWDWTSGADDPLCSTTPPQDYGEQSQLSFNLENNSQLISTAEDQVVFYSWDPKELKLKCCSATASEKDFNKAVAPFTRSCFIPDTSQALSVTTDGSAVVWDNSRPSLEGQPPTEPHVKKPIKLTRLHETNISALAVMNKLIVTGDSAGQIKFFDSKLVLLNWYDTLQLGPLAFISFAHVPPVLPKEGSHYYPPDCTLAARPFMVPDFTISTSTATISHITSNGTTIDVLLNEHNASIHAIATHPSEPRLLVGSYSCRLKLWDYEQRIVLVSRSFKETLRVQCVAFDPRGEFVAVGFTNGTLGILDALTLEDTCPPFCYSHDSVTHVSFSHDSQYIATTDLDLCVSVYKMLAEPAPQWTFLARYRSHYDEIQVFMHACCLGFKLDSNEPRLLSLGKDRTLVEYDLVSSEVDCLKIVSNDRIEQSATPMALTWYPPLTKESFITVVNDQYKLKLYNATTKLCRRTLLGPTYGHPITRMLILPAPIVRSAEGEETRRYMAYATDNKVGLLLLPHDGNPHNSKCLLAHPGNVTDLVCSHDGKYVFTAGGDNCTVNVWKINTEALEAASQLGGCGLTPFYAMLDGGREGELFSELEEFFYYAQIRSQGPDTTCTRQVSTDVDVVQIPYVMRAIGFYPSEQEVDDMLNEVKFSKFVETGKNITSINLEDFIKLYINHRPAFGLSPAELSRAFVVLSGEEEQSGVLDRAKLLSLLQEKGEHITETELIEYLMTLLGHSDNPEVDGSFSEEPLKALQELPSKITVSQYAEELLGLST
eukprot:Em0015g214a